MKKYPKQLTKEEAEELRAMRQAAGLSLYKIAEYIHCKPGRIELLEREGSGVGPDFLERIKKRYKLVIQYKNT